MSAEFHAAVRRSPRDLTVANLSCPFEAMRFHLVYNGPLPPSANKGKPDWARDIRDKIHPQLEYLWRTHTALKRLRSTARVATQPGAYFSGLDSPFEPEFDPDEPLQEGFVDLCEPLQYDSKTYIPLVRKSLDLVCSLDILFLRQEDPGALILQGGDIDGRIKTLLDALTVPKIDVERKYPQAQDVTYCLLESDTLVSGLEVSTDRLLFPKLTYPNEAHLVIEVRVHVLKLGSWNVCLAGD